jgi:hypothetical protein
MDFLHPNAHDDLILFSADMCNLGSMSGLGNFGRVYLGTTISRK